MAKKHNKYVIYITVFVSIISGFYYFTKNIYEEKVEYNLNEFEQSKKWKLSKSLKFIYMLSNDLKAKFGGLKIEELKKENNSLKKKQTELEKKLKKQVTKNSELKNIIKTCSSNSTSIKLHVGESTEIIKNTLLLGLKTVYADMSTKVIIGNKEYDMSIANSISFPFSGKECLVFLKKIENNRSATFAFRWH